MPVKYQVTILVVSISLLCTHLVTFSNVVMRNCGHVICNTCVDMFVAKSKKCYVCETKTKSKDIVDMSPEGTGFASASTKAMAEKFSLAFQ